MVRTPYVGGAFFLSDVPHAMHTPRGSFRKGIEAVGVNLIHMLGYGESL